ncbi:hypothetical protein ACVWZ6_008746 [Bradyrhizobium sp. GM6.1]
MHQAANLQFERMMDEHPLAGRTGGRTIASAGLVVGSGNGGARRARADATRVVF